MTKLKKKLEILTKNMFDVFKSFNLIIKGLT